MPTYWIHDAEKKLEDAIMAGLQNRGVPCQRQVCVPSGVVDILTPDSIVEMKVLLNRKTMREAFVQLYLYRLEVRPTRPHLVIVGLHTKETTKVAKLFTKLGITTVSLYSPDGHLHFEATTMVAIKPVRPGPRKISRLSLPLPFDNIDFQYTFDTRFICDLSISLKISLDSNIINYINGSLDKYRHRGDHSFNQWLLAAEKMSKRGILS